ncbi:MAG: YggS family pyridoxal phosphate-dependent enzyme [Spirochaetae bacterium HGW-Spirochaetae-9]|nr:MAG: YggS family pyridoxal phosphate-dependent enzyme [Spirochaetae bacterium HGW-Spirochaetae-9]
MADYTFVKDNISRIQDKIHAAADRAGRNPGDIRLLAVTKFHPLEAVTAAYACGLKFFGESRVQEAVGKYGAEARQTLPGLSLEMIGTLQSNKVNKALALFDCIQSVGSIELYKAIEARAGLRENPLRLFLELHTGEASKSGFSSIDTLLAAVDAYMEFRSTWNGETGKACPLELLGLMTMAPFTTDTGIIRSSFRALVRAKEEVLKRCSPPGFSELSCGMSGDYEIAIEEGSTMVRIGTAIFGARQ